MRVLVFGDSITQGFWDTEGGWVARIRRHYDKQAIAVADYDQPTVFNLGISANFTKDVIDRIENESIARAPSGEAVIVVIAIGTNDTLFNKQKQWSSPEIFQTELQILVNKAMTITDKILFVGLGPVDNALVQPIPWSSSGKCYDRDRMWRFEQTLRSFCQQRNLPMVELFEAFEQKIVSGDLLQDGLHPNNKGHQLIADLLLPKLNQLINS